MRAPAPDRLSALLAVAALAACGQAPSGEVAVPGARVTAAGSPPESVELVAPREDAQPEPEERATEPEDRTFTAASAPVASRPVGPTWTPPAYVPRGNGSLLFGRSTRSGAGGGRLARAGGSRSPASARAGGSRSPGGGANPGLAGGARSKKKKKKPASTSGVQSEQQMRKRHATPYRGRKIRNPENKGGGQ